MRKISVIGLSALFVGALCGCNWQTEVEVMTGLTEHSFGEVDKSLSRPVGTEWLLRYKGNVTLHIDSIKSSCECLEIWHQESMKAEGHSYFPVRAFLHPELLDTGTFVREVEVYGNFPSSPLVLTVTGHVIDSSAEQQES